MNKVPLKEKDLQFLLQENGRGIGNLTFELMEDGLCKLVRDTTKLSRENRQAVLTVYCSAMALIAFGKFTVDIGRNTARKKKSRPTKSHKRSNVTGPLTYSARPAMSFE